MVRTFVRVSDEGRPQFSDLLGELLQFSDAGVTIATDSGERTVPADRIVAGKRIPPRPQRRAPRRPPPAGDPGTGGLPPADTIVPPPGGPETGDSSTDGS